ncbi:hypothetical protein FRB94_000385 [Tulasnella sp. JGI-2019a]|nr:hypothetical protein FRB94_000385 [Tulasnella sp. JGI-2019a]KAG8997390.1 hypothetical protein FRB93_000394 [Tulasnella sp. JGI-2019a]KAG9028825.1 hypothetical protein FRB95_006052 [Tulasnella sp. JGI-2019a]
MPPARTISSEEPVPKARKSRSPKLILSAEEKKCQKANRAFAFSTGTVFIWKTHAKWAFKLAEMELMTLPYRYFSKSKGPMKQFS